MRRHETIATGESVISWQLPSASRYLTVPLGVLLLSGCSLTNQAPEPVEPPVVSEPIVTIGPEPQPASPPVEAAPAPGRVLILLGDDVPSYVEIAATISQRGAPHSFVTLNLDRKDSLNTEMAAQVATFKPDRIVAIGLNAARAAKTFDDTPMVFCQVFNFEGHELLTPTSNGVKLLPPFSLQFELWKELSPEIQAAGIITGQGQDSLVSEIAAAAAEHDIELLARTVKTDKETLFEFKRLTPKIQGFLLLPDNRILSPRVLREMVAYSKKHGTQIVVFNPQLLQLGADISFSSRSADVADTVLRVIDATSEQQPASRARMTALTTLRADISPEVAATLGSQTSSKLAPYLDMKEQSNP
jgi:ABC-type uncharacterized transport system substrate-binding protein